ncbi:DUF5995 family protein [Phytohabitans houttuyneae]|uniref:DUF5995 family protein n=1 Tax=Phytohabitans houttuyneae TaxID=1076126 RepID=UPI001565DACA|nr:DUF5995 family protein [Phytohabitans houttuyneae]
MNLSMPRRRTLRAALAVVVVSVAIVAAPSPARAAAPGDCADGSPSCVAATIATMRARFAPLGRSCAHNAVFALTYLRTTQTYEWARDQPGFFTDPAWVNHEDAVFARLYFDAYDSWAAGARLRTPGAWLVAFDAARGRKVTAAGNLLLGMNAHINRDLPHALAAVGLTRPDGSSRKPDHDKVNDFLAAVLAPLQVELTARLDPTGLATGLPPDSAFQLILGWREQAWRYAERLVSAPNPVARALVAAEIEAHATAQAVLYAGLAAYVPPLSTPAARDAHCAVHNGDQPPAYPFGTPPPY